MEVIRKIAMPLDSISGYNSAVERKDGGTGGGGGGFLPDGTRIAFGRDEQWPADIAGKPAIHLDTIREMIEWGLDNKPVRPPRILGPGEPFPDVDALNKLIPQERWLSSKFEDGKLVGPVQNQHVVIFGDPSTMTRYVWPSPVSTIGSAIAVRELTEAVKRMRQFRGEIVYALVEFARRRFPTRRGERQRPHLQILGFVRPTDRGLERVDTEALPGLQRVAEPSLREELKDEVPWK